MVSGIPNVYGQDDGVEADAGYRADTDPYTHAEADTFGPAMFRTAMSRFPTGVTIVTTDDEHGNPSGFTASSFCSVSTNPPLILVCLATSANSYPVFARCDRFAVSILRPQHTELARRFASKNTDKFVGTFAHTPGGLTVVDGALAVFECGVHERHEAGDHVIMIGRVRSVWTRAGDPVVYHDREFGTLAPNRVGDPGAPVPVGPVGQVRPRA